MRGPLVYCLTPGSDKALAGLDTADLGGFVLDPSALVSAADLTLGLTEFADPGGIATYFRRRDFNAAVDDKLARPGARAK